MSLRKLLFCVGVSLTLALAAGAQQPANSTAPPAQAQPPAKTPPPAKTAAPAPPPPAPPDVSDAWGDVLQNAVPPPHPDMALAAPQVTSHYGPAADFANHLFFEMRTEYTRTQTYFSGQPTATGVIDGPPETVVTPAGIPYSPVFQPSTNEMYSFMNFGTRGWGSDRVNTNFSLRYRTDLTSVNPGSPSQGILNSFPQSRVFELQTGYVEINGKPSDGFFSDSSVRLGRQYVYGAELASFDGLSFSRNRPKYSLTVYGGRRFTYYSDPEQRAIGGVSLVYRFRNASLEYSGLFYVKGSHLFTYRQRLPKDWLLNSYFKMVNGHPVDFSVSGMWSPSNGKTTLLLGFVQKLTNQDYFYDYTYGARDLDPYNPLLRLNLGPQSPYSQFTIDVHRDVLPRLRLGGTLWVRRLNDSNDQGPFDTSFQDYRVNAQVFPWKRIETFIEYHERDLDRKNPVPATTFDDITATGETKDQDFSLQLGKSFAEGKVSVRGGGFFRRVDFQDRFFFINNAQDKGWLGNAAVRLDQHSRLYFDYSLDTDFFVWRPSIKNGQVFRFGIDWKY